MATLWRAPIIVTTAVQFFQTLANSKPAQLRKLHELPGSAVFVDEAHAAIPSKLWPQTWLWLKELAVKWSCHFVFASGTLSRFWSLPAFVNPPVAIPELVGPDLQKRALLGESKRIIYRRNGCFQSRQELLDFVVSKPGPRLLIVNTVQSAAVLADTLYKIGKTVLHLSTALAPIDRNRIIRRIERCLACRNCSDWTLIATSCVEAGMDFSFRTAFRESCSTASLIQIGGRVNRGGNSEIASEVWDFRILDPLLNRNRAFDNSRRVLDSLLSEKQSGVGNDLNFEPAELVTEALRREVLSDENTDLIKKAEADWDYPKVTKLYQVIEGETCLVVVDSALAQTLQKRWTGSTTGTHSKKCAVASR